MRRALLTAAALTALAACGVKAPPRPPGREPPPASSPPTAPPAPPSTPAAPATP